MASLQDWENFLDSHPEAHLLQTAPWGRLKSAFGWRSFYCIENGAGTQVLLRPLRLGFHIGYLPRGPVPSSQQALAAVQPALDDLCRSHRVIFLRIEPDWADSQICRTELRNLGYLPAPHTVQPPRTVLVDLAGTEEELLGRMRSKTRYNIRLAMRHGVTVVPSSDTETFARMIQITGDRDSFSIHSEAYYRQAYEVFAAREQVVLLLAYFQEEPIAGLMAFSQGRRSWYLYGASTDLHREVMAPHLLQWEAMRWARSHGCTEYDLWGIPDEAEEILEAQFATRQDGLWGVYRFKRGFGGRVQRSVGAWDRIFHRPAYRLYQILTGRRARDQA